MESKVPETPEKFMGMYNMIQGHVLRVTERRDHLTFEQQLEELNELELFLGSQLSSVVISKMRVREKIAERDEGEESLPIG